MNPRGRAGLRHNERPVVLQPPDLGAAEPRRTPLVEARRLGRTGLAEALVVAGARSKVKKTDQF